MIGHPDADALAACREGLLGRRRSARIRAHLARCSRCASLDRELAAVTTLLASAPEPRIPDQLAARLDTVLAAESAARARGESPAADGVPAADGIPATDGFPATAGAAAGAADGQAAPAGPAGSRPGRPRSTRPDRSRSTHPVRPWRVTALRAASVTAVLLVIAGGGYGVSRLLAGGSGTGASSSSGGPASAPGAAPGAEVPREGSNSGGGSSRAGLMIPSGGVSLVHSGTDYQPGQLAAQAEAVLASRPAHSGGQPASAVPSTTVAGCVRLFAGVARPVLVDEARYRGQPATIIIRAPAGARPGHVWVVVPNCSAAGRHLISSAVLPASG
jgi:hypothetical protein